ncbi:glycoside hydrolase family 2 TIM barrel-domain containing protein [Seonamhaeicola marinus]|uniref:Glycoside hydrolase family 2 protein n=1 Tax=Seonamhaeicola marinus TaxID=1912246 RepID=A0A5D0HTJ5_9FLAO|nr:glycoside hydrolase family 2 TIM barrel-domain containing protein [Seonamhaeicola marinus]TYA74638.1 glycoside hydrolase family 2 protein [Seonamhaeicola marinus]
MKTLLKISIYGMLLCTLGCNKPQTLNTKESFDFGWKFIAEDVSGAEALNFNDASWTDVNVPHDWSIEGNFSKDNPSFSRGGWLQTGKVTYRKTFSVAKEDKDKRFVIYFDGAYRNSEVFINGHSLGKRPLGYIAFHYDMTNHIKFGGDNVLTVKLDNSSQPGSRWYTGTGIYRHVHLIKTNKVYVPIWGNYIVADNYTSEKAEIKITTQVRNDLGDGKTVTVRHTAKAPNGEDVGSSSEVLTVGASATSQSKVVLEISNPQIWSQELPNLYTIKTEILEGDVVVYSEENKTGIRTLEFDKNEGFKLNGKVTKLKGVCLHHAGGPLGAAIHRRTVERQLEKLREMGSNAVRTAHNPFSEEFLKVCDSMGFLVMNEAFDEWELIKEPMTTQNGKKIRIPVDFYANQFKEWADIDLEDMLLRDRNHPSVIMWSIGNEIDQMRDEEGIAIGKRLADIVHRLDYRPVTNGVHGYWDPKRPNQDAAATSDIYGFNYITEERYLTEMESLPNIRSVITEHQSAQSFYPRSTYLYDEAKKAWWDKLNYEHNDAYEWVESRDIRGEKGMEAWRMVKKYPNIMGMFIWTGWDYLGEVIPFGWPARSSCFAPIDLAGFKKDGFYFYQSQWDDKPMVHIYPHWNLKGMEGKKVTIYGFTNGDEVELFQDGKSLGRKTNDSNAVEYQSWDVVYQPGELKAVSYKNGNVIAEKVVKTAGAPAKIKVETRRTEMKANGQDVIYVECTILDKDGNEVPTANNTLKFDVKGPVTIAGVGNGDSMGLEPFKANKRSAFHGKCLAILQSTQEAGDITCTITSEGLETVIVALVSK